MMRLTYQFAWALWWLSTVPVLIWSFVVREFPMAPAFTSESTLEGKLIWAICASWIFLAPGTLLYMRPKCAPFRQTNEPHAKN